MLGVGNDRRGKHRYQRWSSEVTVIDAVIHDIDSEVQCTIPQRTNAVLGKKDQIFEWARCRKPYIETMLGDRVISLVINHYVIPAKSYEDIMIMATRKKLVFDC